MNDSDQVRIKERKGGGKKEEGKEEKKEETTKGTHIISEFSGAPFTKLDNLEEIKKLLKEAINQGNATFLAEQYHKFEPQGVSGIILLAESHISIHTWPEKGYASVDMYTCGRANPYKACLYLAEHLEVKKVMFTLLQRGIFDEENSQFTSKIIKDGTYEFV